MKEISFPGLCSRLIQPSAKGNSAWHHRVWAAGKKIGGWMGSLGQERSLSIFSLSLAVFKSIWNTIFIHKVDPSDLWLCQTVLVEVLSPSLLCDLGLVTWCLWTSVSCIRGAQWWKSNSLLGLLWRWTVECPPGPLQPMARGQGVWSRQ